MLIPALRPIAISILLFHSAAAISQSGGYANKPFTATKKTTFIQKLADGTSITRESTSIEARDSQGRTMQQGSLMGLSGKNITHTNVMDPVARTTTIWMSEGKQATRIHMGDLRGAPQQSGPRAAGPSPTVIGVASGSSSLSQTIQSVGTAAAPEMTGTVTMSAGSVRDPNLQAERKTEKLGGKTIAGVYAEGIRMIVTYPVGFFGNDKPLITIHETWRSSDLRLIVLSVDDDPRTGTRITEVTDLDRGEPNPALFQIPDGYPLRISFPQPTRLDAITENPMKWYNYVACFLAGVFLIHILPHALNGLTLTNVLGILVSLVSGCLLLWAGKFSLRNPVAIFLVLLGMASVLIFTKLHPRQPHAAAPNSIDSPMQ